MADLSVQNEGSLFLLLPLTSGGKSWIDEHIPEDAMWFSNGVVVEPRYIADIVQGAINDGLEVI